MVDLNGKEIVDRDIVKYSKNQKVLFIVYGRLRSPSGLMVVPLPWIVDTHTFFCIVNEEDYWLNEENIKFIEVIGNEKDNPELMPKPC